MPLSDLERSVLSATRQHLIDGWTRVDSCIDDKEIAVDHITSEGPLKFSLLGALHRAAFRRNAYNEVKHFERLLRTELPPGFKGLKDFNDYQDVKGPVVDLITRVLERKAL